MRCTISIVRPHCAVHGSSYHDKTFRCVCIRYLIQYCQPDVRRQPARPEENESDHARKTSRCSKRAQERSLGCPNKRIHHSQRLAGLNSLLSQEILRTCCRINQREDPVFQSEALPLISFTAGPRLASIPTIREAQRAPIPKPAVAAGVIDLIDSAITEYGCALRRSGYIDPLLLG